MDIPQNSVWYVVLGSILALATSLTVEFIKYLLKNHTDTKDYKIILKLELKSIISSVDKLIDNFGTAQFFKIAILNEINLKISRLDKIRDKITFIKSDLKKEEILLLVNDVYLFYTDTYSIETSAFRSPNDPIQGVATEWNADIYKSQRQMMAIKSVDLKRKIQELIVYLDNN